MFKKGILDQSISGQISKLITEVCCPAMIILCVSTGEVEASAAEIFGVFLLSVAVFAVMIGLGGVIGRILRAGEKDLDFYTLLTVYGNIGFIGLPVAQAIFGGMVILYLTIFNVTFNLYIFSHGIWLIQKKEGGQKMKFGIRPNVGMISCLVALLIVLLKIRMPELITSYADYVGGCTTFLSLLVLGCSLTRLNLVQILQEKKLYLFCLLRMIVIPLLTGGLLCICGAGYHVVMTVVLVLSMPAGNMPLMLAEKYGRETSLLAKGIAMSTCFCVISITLNLVVAGAWY